jgi:hypothetical protein
MWKEMVKAELRCCSIICLEELRKATKTEGLLVCQIQVNHVATTPHKPKDAGVPNTIQHCYHYTI